MTTNQTIDGVRTLAEQACGTSPDSPEYRRFIAAMNPTLLLDLTSPAAQPQGEPVAWQYRVSAGPQTGWSLWHDGKGEEFKRSYQVETRPLYAEQPALVAVVLPERSYASDEDQQSMTDYEIGLGHGACEMWDKIKALNPSL